MSEQNVLLVVDDDQELSALISEIGRRCGYSVAEACNSTAFRQVLAQSRPALVILDLQMDDMDGVEALRQLSTLCPGADVLLLSGLDVKVLASARQFGLTLGLNMIDALQKPVRMQALEALLSQRVGLAAPISGEEVRRALREYEFALHYQPILHRINDNWVIGTVEALVRWRHPQRGLLYPKEFLPVVEREELMAALTDVVLDESLRQVGHWHQRDLKLSLTVNLAASLVRDLNFPDRLSQVLREHGVAPEYLCFDVTEAASVGDFDVVMDSFARLRVRGVELALDDFGVGTSSLTQLYRMPYSLLKIDHTLIAEMTYSPQARTVVSALVDLGHRLGLSVCAEGVESQAAFSVLERMGCDRLQGDYISRAMSAADLEAFLRTWCTDNSASMAISA